MVVEHTCLPGALVVAHREFDPLVGPGSVAAASKIAGLAPVEANKIVVVLLAPVEANKIVVVSGVLAAVEANRIVAVMVDT